MPAKSVVVRPACGTSCQSGGASCSRLSPLPGLTSSVEPPRSAAFSRREGNLPIPSYPNLIIGGGLSKPYFGFFSTKTRGIPAKSGATRSHNVRSWNRGSTAPAWPWPSSSKAAAPGPQQSGQQLRQAAIGIQPVQPAIQRRARFVQPDLRVQARRCRRWGYRAGWRRSDRSGLIRVRSNPAAINLAAIARSVARRLARA